jgi:protein TonB
MRNWIASAPSFLFFLVAAILTIIGTQKPPMHKPDRTPMRVTIAQPPAEPTPPPAPAPELPQMIAPPTPDIVLPPMPKLSQRPTAKPVPAQTAQPTQSPQPAAEPTAAPSAAATAPARPQAAAATAAAGQDDVYSSQVRAYLESIKHYPTSKEARLQRPRGAVEVWFVLDRSGGVKDAGIETSSGSLILDGAALSLVRGASYPAFPSDAFRSEATHRFTVHLNYTLT